MFPRFTEHREFALFVLNTNRKNSKHHGLHINTSKDVVTVKTSAGDEIIYRLPGHLDLDHEWSTVHFPDASDVVYEDNCWVVVKAEAVLAVVSEFIPRPKKNEHGETYFFDCVTVTLGSLPGRGPMLGEDGLEDAFGEPVIEELLCEYMGSRLYLPGGRYWRYAAAEVTETEATEDRPNRPPSVRKLILSVEYQEGRNGWFEY